MIKVKEQTYQNLDIVNLNSLENYKLEYIENKNKAYKCLEYKQK